MNKIIIANYRETEPQVISREGNSFAVKPVIREADAGKCAASFVEVEPGRYAYGYHYHEVNEEVFYIIRGHAVVRTPEGEKNLKEGMRLYSPPARRERMLSVTDPLRKSWSIWMWALA
mgnify:FL=1